MSQDTISERIRNLNSEMIENQQYPFCLIINRESLFQLIEESGSSDIFINFRVFIQEDLDLNLITCDEYDKLVEKYDFQSL